MEHVVCIDGTGNDPDQKDQDPLSLGEFAVQTNVLVAWSGLTGVTKPPDPLPPEGAVAPLSSRPGLALYLPGVGTQGWRSLFQKAIGSGTSQRICVAYRFLAESCSAQDRLFCFGFSRGAFAVRSLAGFLEHVGLPLQRGPMDLAEVDRLYRIYTSRQPFDKSAAHHRPANVHFLGLWDTVGAILSRQENHRISPPNIGFVAHALALDEIRPSFNLELWDPGSLPPDRVAEVWFAGVHSNVGGGYTDHNLSNIAFFWVMRAAELHGLPIDLPSMQRWAIENSGMALRQSATAPWRLLDAIRDLLSHSNRRTAIRTNQEGQRIHQSVFERMQNVAVIPPYTPTATNPLIPNFWGQFQNPIELQKWLEDWNC